MYLLIRDGQIKASHENLNAWEGRLPEGFTVSSYDGAFPAYPDGKGEPNEYLWDGKVPRLDPGRSAAAGARKQEALEGAYSQDDPAARLLRGLVHAINARMGGNPIGLAEIVERGVESQPGRGE